MAALSVHAVTRLSVASLICDHQRIKAFVSLVTQLIAYDGAEQSK